MLIFFIRFLKPGKYFGKNFNNVGSCSFEQLEVISGCGSGVFLSALHGAMPTAVIVAFNVTLVLFFGFQALTAVSAWMLGYDLGNFERKPRN